jgi:hypothetical protein
MERSLLKTLASGCRCAYIGPDAIDAAIPFALQYVPAAPVALATNQASGAIVVPLSLCHHESSTLLVRLESV